MLWDSILELYHKILFLGYIQTDRNNFRSKWVLIADFSLNMSFNTHNQKLILTNV